mgnify:CR=1 FL=1
MTRTDVTKRKQAEARERDGDLLMRRVLEASPAAVVMAQVGSGDIIYRSPAAVELFGKVRNAMEIFPSPGDRADYITTLLADGYVDEYKLNLITTMPNVEYHVYLKDGPMLLVDNPARYPDAGKIDHVREPIVSVEIITPSEFVGAVMKLNKDRRGIYKKMEYLTKDRAVIKYDMPLAEILIHAGKIKLSPTLVPDLLASERNSTVKKLDRIKGQGGKSSFEQTIK